MTRGRPRRVTGASSKRRIDVRLTDAERSDLEDVARANDTTITEVVREAINEYVSDFRDRRVFVRRNAAARPHS